MDNKAKAMRQHLRVKLAEKEMEEKKEKARLEKKANRRVDGILIAEEDNLYYSEEPISLTQMTILQCKKDPGCEPGRCGVYNESGRVSFMP
jgi:hypothetical protein